MFLRDFTKERHGRNAFDALGNAFNAGERSDLSAESAKIDMQIPRASLNPTGRTEHPPTSAAPDLPRTRWFSATERSLSRGSGESIEVLNRGKPSVRIVPAAPRKIIDWDDHLATAISGGGRTAEETVAADREGRW